MEAEKKQSRAHAADRDAIARDLRKTLDHDRYVHTLGVSYTAASLAMRYGYDMEKALLAGLLHDCAKCIPWKKKVKLCEQNNIPITKSERLHPALLHAKLGAFLAKAKYHVTDAEIRSAIACHTTGKPNMQLLDKILYVADYIEPNRCKAPRLSKIRRTAFVDLNEALLMILADTVSYLEENGDYSVDPLTAQTYAYYQKEMQTQDKQSETNT